MISSFPSNAVSKMNTAADVQLISSNMILEFWASEQPSDPKKPFPVEVKILPENFLTNKGERISRADLMLVLHGLKQLRIKACYYSDCQSATISDFQLEVARDDQNSFDNLFTATSIELCSCPPPYSGSSCQVYFLFPSLFF